MRMLSGLLLLLSPPSPGGPGTLALSLPRPLIPVHREALTIGRVTLPPEIGPVIK